MEHVVRSFVLHEAVTSEHRKLCVYVWHMNESLTTKSEGIVGKLLLVVAKHYPLSVRW